MPSRVAPTSLLRLPAPLRRPEGFRACPGSLSRRLRSLSTLLSRKFTFSTSRGLNAHARCLQVLSPRSPASELVRTLPRHKLDFWASRDLPFCAQRLYASSHRALRRSSPPRRHRDPNSIFRLPAAWTSASAQEASSSRIRAATKHPRCNLDVFRRPAAWPSAREPFGRRPTAAAQTRVLDVPRRCRTRLCAQPQCTLAVPLGAVGTLPVLDVYQPFCLGRVFEVVRL